MGKKKRSKKRRYPWNLEEEKLFTIGKTGNEILCDAGWEKISFEKACEFFSPEVVREWYSSYWEEADISDLSAELGIDINQLDDQDLEKFLESYDWTPKEVNVVVAKAIYENHRWIRVLTISTPEFEEYIFQNHEMEAIYLGIHLRNYLKLDIPVINDCKNAVRYLYGRYPNIGWQSRKCVKAAHNLKISQATQLFDEERWDLEWEEEYWDFN
ncbi:MAG: hypothetical protein AAGG00_18720 [Cyanobacteria bacterium P01_H01_bin.150]